MKTRGKKEKEKKEVPKMAEKAFKKRKPSSICRVLTYIQGHCILVDQSKSIIAYDKWGLGTYISPRFSAQSVRSFWRY